MLGDLSSRDVIVSQTKAQRLGMYLTGKCSFYKSLVEQLGPKSVRSVALCTKDKGDLGPLLKQFKRCEVFAYDGKTIAE